MKKTFLMLSMFFAMLTTWAQTIQVNGCQSGIWDADTVLVTGDVKVEGALEVLPGTTVLFDGFYSISVSDGAEFSALGSADDSIVFTVADTTGFYNEYYGKGGWNGFQVEMGRARFDYCVLQYGKAINEDKDEDGGAINIQGGDVAIAHSTLRCNFSCDRGGAIHAENADLTMYSCRVNDNVCESENGAYAMYGGGISLLKCHVEMSDMEFLRNYGPRCIGGALSCDSCKVDLHNAVFADNYAINGGGMYMMRNNHTVSTVYNVVFRHNYSYHFGGGLAFADSSPYVYNLLVTDNSSEGVNCNGVFFYGHCQPKVYNCIVYGNYPPYDPGFPMDSIQMWVWATDEYSPEFYNCLIEGGRSLIMSEEYIKVFEDVIDADPLFMDASNLDFRLQEGSPCRDAGHAFVPYDLLEGTDLGGLRRVSNGRIDIGPYEYSASSVPQYDMGLSWARLIGTPLNAESCLVTNLSRPQKVMVKVCSLTGRVVSEMVFEAAAGLQQWKLDGLAEKLASGLYVFEVVADEGICSIKAVR